MRSALPLRPLLLCAFAAAAAGCGSDSPGMTMPDPDPVHVPNFVKLQSDDGDWIGAGRSFNYTQADAVISVTANGGLVSVAVNGDEWWNAQFQAPGATIQKGTYAGLARYPFHDPAKGGLIWGGEGRDCTTLTGSFTVDSVTYTAGKLARLDLRFEQHCGGAAAALRGTIHWRDDDTTAPAGPVSPAPSGLWQPPAGLPGAGNYAFLQSDPGDWVGAGQTQLYTAPAAPVSVTADGGHVTVSVGGWRGDFQTMGPLTQLQPGYYGGLMRYPFHNPAKGGMDWGGNGRGCNKLSGWFMVDQATYSGGSLTALDLRFEQHCEGSPAALRGAVHWRA